VSFCKRFEQKTSLFAKQSYDEHKKKIIKLVLDEVLAFEERFFEFRGEFPEKYVFIR
jgi:hypothetical protein